MFNNGTGFRAGGTIAPYRFVSIDPTEDGQVVQATVGSLIAGISQPGMNRTPGLAGSDFLIAAEDGDLVHLYSHGDICPLMVGEVGIAQNTLLTADVEGKGITGLAGDEIGAIALQSASEKDVVILVQILNRPG